jgi:CheY-like chemotaxis protein
MNNARILVVDGEKSVRDLCERSLTKQGYYVRVAGNGQHCLELLKKTPFNLVLLGLMPGIKGTGVEIKNRYRYIEVITIAGQGALKSAVNSGKLESAVKECLEKQRLTYGLVDLSVPYRTGLLDKIKHKRSFGIYIENNKLYFADVELTLKGAFLQKSICVDYSPETFRRQIERLISCEIPGSKKKAKSFIFASAVPGQALFYSGSILQGESVKKMDPAVLVSENPRFAFVDSSEIVWDWFFTKLKGQNFVFVGAAKHSLVEKMLRDFYQLDLQPIRIEPEPWAALRVSWHYNPPQTRKAPEIRFLFGDSTILVVLSYRKVPLAWQFLEFDRKNLTDILYSGAHSLMVHAERHLKIGEVGTVVLQGRGKLSEQAKALEVMFGHPVIVLPGPGYDGHLVAFGLALGALTPTALAVNLARKIQKPLSLKMLFPQVEAFVAGAVVLMVLLNMWGRVQKIDRTLIRIKRENAISSWSMGKNFLMLDAEKKKLLKQVKPMGAFLGKKINWSPYLESLVSLIPANARIAAIEAEDQIWQKIAGRKYGNNYLLIYVTAGFSSGGKAPESIDECLNAFRESPLFRKELPRVELASINWKKEEGRDYAYFSILAVPKQAKKK